MARSKQVLFAAAVIAGAYEVVAAFFLEVPAVPLVFAVLFLGAAWALRGRRATVATVVLWPVVPVRAGGVAVLPA
ncbi:MAG: hypothetical protein M3Q98_06205 [Actinomycetota bacterium]|nr:hypothetical protein [Actinomycetota bacterium]